MSKVIILLTMLPIIFLSQVFSQSSMEELKKDYQKEIEKLMRKKNIPGTSVVLIEKDSIIWEAYFGYADKDEMVKVDSNTLFKTGSVTKLFTGTAVMQLKERGLIDLDAPVNDYLPSFNMYQRFEHSKPITSRLLLTHQAGLPSDIMKGFVSDSAEPYTEQLNYLNQEYAAYPAGYMRAYSNPGFTLLGIMVAEVAQKPYISYVGDEIFNPLGMEKTTFLEPYTSHPYLSADFTRKGDFTQDSYLRDVPAGGILSTAKDLSKFLSVWINDEDQKVLQPDVRKEMLTIQTAAPLDLNYPFALAWMADLDTKAGNIFHHGGATFYHRAMIAFAPEIDMGIVILTNAAAGNSICSLYDDILEKVAEIKGYTETKKYDEDGDYPTKKIKLATDNLKKYTGTYALPIEAYEISLNKNKLEMTIQDTRVKLIPVADSTFIPKVLLVGPLGIKIKQVRFYFDEVAGEHLLIQEEVETGEKEILGQKITLPEIPQEWKNRYGKYEILNADSADYPMFEDFELRENKGKIEFVFTINFDNNPTFKPALIPVNDSLAYISGLGRQGGQSVRVMENDAGEDILYYSGYQLKKAE